VGKLPTAHCLLPLFKPSFVTIKEAHLDYVLRLADNAFILGHRLSEWCGHGPVLEQDIAMTNIALDLVGQSRALYQYAAELKGNGKTEDDLAFLRDVGAFRNALLVEQPNEDWAYTIVRQFLFDAYNYFFYRELTGSKDATLSAFAKKTLKEVTYHLRFSSEWMIRLGDGTEVSHQKMQNALNDRWMFSGELLFPNETDHILTSEGIGVDLEKMKPFYDQKISEILDKANLQKPESDWMQKGGKDGRHTEHLGHILAELQFVQRAYPGLEW